MWFKITATSVMSGSKERLFNEYPFLSKMSCKTKPKVWSYGTVDKKDVDVFIWLNSLDDLFEFTEKLYNEGDRYGSCENEIVVTREDDGSYSIEIYDDWRE